MGFCVDFVQAIYAPEMNTQGERSPRGQNRIVHRFLKNNLNDPWPRPQEEKEQPNMILYQFWKRM